MRKVTTVRPKELNLFNRDFGNLKQYVLENVPEDAVQNYLFDTITERIFERAPDMNNKSCEILLKFVDEEYQQQIEDHLQIITLSNDIILKNEYDDIKRKSIRCSKKNKTTLDIIIEEFSTEDFIKYLCEEQISENKEIFSEVKFSILRLTSEEEIGYIHFLPINEIQNIKLPKSVIYLIDKVIKLYPELEEKSNFIQTSFICKSLVTAEMILHCNVGYTWLLSNSDFRYQNAVKSILNKLDAWKTQLFFCHIRKKFELYTEGKVSSDNVLRSFERKFSKVEKEQFGDFLENNFLTNIVFGVLFVNENAISLFYKQEKEKQNIIKNFVVKISTKIKESLEKELKDFDIHDLEKADASKEDIELATILQLRMIDYNWLEVYIRDDQVKKKGVNVKSWNLYNNITKAVLKQSIYGFKEIQEKKFLKKMVQVQGKYSLNNLCQKDFDQLAFSCLAIAFYEKDITKDNFIEEQLKMGVSKELINLFFNLIEE